MILPPYILGHYFIPVTNFMRKWNGKAALEERKNGVVLSPRKFLKFMHSGMLENAPFKLDGGDFDH